MNRPLCLFASLACVAGCSGSTPSSAADLGSNISYTPPPLATPSDWNALPLPKTDGGGIVVIELPGMKLLLDPSKRTPVSALGDCARGLLGCVAEGHTLDDCVGAVPPCKTDKPWEEPTLCCPARCAVEYRVARGQGMTTNLALKAAYFKRAGCFPGIPAKN